MTLGKIDIRHLIKEHTNTFILKDLTKKNSFKRDNKALFVFFIFPILISIIAVRIFGNMSSSFSNSLLTCLSILSPLMFGFFPFIYDLIDNKEINPKSRYLIQQFKANVLFTMILSFTTLAVILLWTLANNNLNIINNYFDEKTAPIIINYILISLSGIVYYLLICLSFHILMIIQRFNFLINQYNIFKNNNT
jgi:hypothetical protein